MSARDLCLRRHSSHKVIATPRLTRLAQEQQHSPKPDHTQAQRDAATRFLRRLLVALYHHHRPPWHSMRSAANERAR